MSAAGRLLGQRARNCGKIPLSAISHDLEICFTLYATPDGILFPNAPPRLSPGCERDRIEKTFSRNWTREVFPLMPTYPFTLYLIRAVGAASLANVSFFRELKSVFPIFNVAHCENRVSDEASILKLESRRSLVGIENENSTGVTGVLKGFRGN